MLFYECNRSSRTLFKIIILIFSKVLLIAYKTIYSETSILNFISSSLITNRDIKANNDSIANPGQHCVRGSREEKRSNGWHRCTQQWDRS